MLVVILVISIGSHTSLVASNLLVGSLSFITLGDNGRDVAAGLAVAVGRGHSRHDGRFVTDRSVTIELCISQVSIRDMEEITMDLGQLGWIKNM